MLLARERLEDYYVVQASMYLNKLPIRFASDDRILLCDPMIATGDMGCTLSLDVLVSVIFQVVLVNHKNCSANPQRITEPIVCHISNGR